METNDIRDKIGKRIEAYEEKIKERKRTGQPFKNALNYLEGLKQTLALIPEDHMLVPRDGLLTEDDWQRLISELLIAKDAYCNDKDYEKLLKKLEALKLDNK